jgi:hypothetical protein
VTNNRHSNPRLHYRCSECESISIQSAEDFSSKFSIHFLAFFEIIGVKLIPIDQLMVKQKEIIKQVKHKTEQNEI